MIRLGADRLTCTSDKTTSSKWFKVIHAVDNVKVTWRDRFHFSSKCYPCQTVFKMTSFSPFFVPSQCFKSNSTWIQVSFEFSLEQFEFLLQICGQALLGKQLRPNPKLCDTNCQSDWQYLPKVIDRLERMRTISTCKFETQSSKLTF